MASSPSSGPPERSGRPARSESSDRIRRQNAFPATGMSTYYCAANRKPATSSGGSPAAPPEHAANKSRDRPRAAGSLTYRSSVCGLADRRNITVNRSVSVCSHRSGPSQRDSASKPTDEASTAGSTDKSTVATHIGRKATTVLAAPSTGQPVAGKSASAENSAPMASPSSPKYRTVVRISGAKMPPNDVDNDRNGCRVAESQIKRTVQTPAVDQCYMSGDGQTVGAGTGRRAGPTAGCVRLVANAASCSHGTNNTTTPAIREARQTVRVGEHEGDEEDRFGHELDSGKPSRRPDPTSPAQAATPRSPTTTTTKASSSTAHVTNDSNKHRNVVSSATETDLRQASSVERLISSSVNGSSRTGVGEAATRRSNNNNNDYDDDNNTGTRLDQTGEGDLVRSDGAQTTEPVVTGTDTTMASNRRPLPEPPVGEDCPSPEEPSSPPPVPPHRQNGHHPQARRTSRPLPRPGTVPAEAVTGAAAAAATDNGLANRGADNAHDYVTTPSAATTTNGAGYATETSSDMSDSVDSDRSSSVATDSGYREYFQQRFHMDELSAADDGGQNGEAKLGSSPDALQHPLLLSQRNILNPDEDKITKIISNRGTIRGLKNLVKAGIATYAEKQEKIKNYRLIEAGKVVLYTTSVKIIRETHDRCVKAKRILQTHMIKYEERDIFMSRKNQEELRERLGSEYKEVPQIFAGGQHIGGLEELESMNESGELRTVFKQFKRVNRHTSCARCGGYQYIPCSVCHGSKKSQNRNYFTEAFSALRCTHCDENGLIKCDMCINGEVPS